MLWRLVTRLQSGAFEVFMSESLIDVQKGIMGARDPRAVVVCCYTNFGLSGT
jgi:hypothetical protein